MKKNRENLKNYITYSWYIILLICVFSYSFAYYIISALTEYKKEEVFSVFVTLYGIKDESLEDKLLNKYSEYGIEEVNIYNFSYENKDIASYYANFGTKSDIVILYESDLNDMQEFIKDYFIPLTFTQFETYDYENEAYAIKIYDVKEEKNYLDNFFDFTGNVNEDSYLLINKKSVHFSTKNSLGYLILNDLLEEKI